MERGEGYIKTIKISDLDLVDGLNCGILTEGSNFMISNDRNKVTVYPSLNNKIYYHKRNRNNIYTQKEFEFQGKQMSILSD